MTSYQALVNLSQPRKDNSKETDLIAPGETVDLTDEQAAQWLPPHRAFAMIRKAEGEQALPAVLPRQMFGIAINPRTGKLLGRPGPPAEARPDPPGSSTVQVQIPEAAEPQPGSENEPPPQDAVDLPPRRRAAAAKG